MIHELTGDILLSGARAIAHGVAPNDPFHSGLALAIRERFPSLYKDFRHHCRAAHPKEGEIWAWSGMGEHGPLHVIQLFTQQAAYGQGERPGRARAEWVGHALGALAKHVTAEGIPSLALPRLATGVGGLDWNEVHPLVRQHLGKLAIPVHLYTTFHAGVRASEPAA